MAFEINCIFKDFFQESPSVCYTYLQILSRSEQELYQPGLTNLVWKKK